MRINKHDTNGTKPLLGKGELGYDDYTAGGDTGRVYVGNGASNIALAKKSEVDAKVVANAGITAGTATKVTYDAKGLVTSGTNPTTLGGYGITDAYTKTEMNTQISTAVSGLVDAAPGTLDTLNKLAAALGDDPNFATTTANNIAAKVPKVTSTDNAIVRFDGTTGDVQNSSVTINDSGNLLVGTTTDNGIDKLQVNGTISSGDIQQYASGDLNNFKYITQTIGTYPSAYMSNTPIDDHGYLEIIVYSANTYVMQRFTTLGARQTAGRVFVRCLTNGTWTAWAEK